MRIYLPEKVNNTFKGRKILLSTENVVNNCFLIWLFINKLNFPTFAFVVKVMFNLRTSFSNCY